MGMGIAKLVSWEWKWQWKSEGIKTPHYPISCAHVSDKREEMEITNGNGKGMGTRSLAIAKRPCDYCIILKSGSYTKAISC